MLRAQVAQKPAPSRPSAGSSNPAAEDLAAPVAIDEEPITKPRATRKPRSDGRHGRGRDECGRRGGPGQASRHAEAGGVSDVGGLQGGRCHGSGRRR